MNQLFWLLGGGLAALVGVALFLLRRGGISPRQQKQLLDSYEDMQRQTNDAERQAQTDQARVIKDEHDGLRELARREAQADRAINSAKDPADVAREAQAARKRWSDTINMPWYIGLVVVWFALSWPPQCAHANDFVAITKQLTADLNACAHTVRRERIIHRAAIAKQRIDHNRVVTQKDAVIRQCRQESLIYRTRPTNNTALVVGVTVASTVAIVATALVFVAIYRPDLFGNTRGIK